MPVVLLAQTGHFFLGVCDMKHFITVTNLYHNCTHCVVQFANCDVTQNMSLKTIRHNVKILHKRVFCNTPVVGDNDGEYDDTSEMQEFSSF